MEKEFIPYEEALALKELGFDEPCFGYYTNKQELELVSITPTNSDSGHLPTAPLYQQAFRWFRENKDLLNHITTHLNTYGEDGALEESYGYRIMINKDGWKCSVWEELSFFDTYEEAELACIKKLIEIISHKLQ